MRLFSLLMLGMLFSVLCANATPSNVALNRPVQVSSQNNLNTPGWVAVDGVTSASARRWVSNTTPPHWIEIRLDGHYNLSRLRLWTGANGYYSYAARDFALQQWDGFAWQDILSELDHPNTGVVDLSFPATLSSDRIRFRATRMADGAQNQMRMFEIEVHGELHALQVGQLSPADNSAIHDLNTPIHVDFSEAITAVDLSGVRVVRKTDNQVIPSGAVSITGNRLSLSPVLSHATSYEVMIPSGAVMLSGDPSVHNAAVFWTFTALPPQPLVASHRSTLAAHESLAVTFDRPVIVQDMSLIRVVDLATNAEVAIAGIEVQGNTLIFDHAELGFRQSLLIEFQAGAVEAPATSTPNQRIALHAYSGEFVVLPEVTFSTGLEGFLTGFTEGQIGSLVRRWSWLAGNTAAGEPNAGPGGDFTWVGTNRTYEGDFAATPGLMLEEGEEYTLTFKYMLNNSDLRVDLRTTPRRDVSDAPTAVFADNFGVSSVGNVTVTAQTSGMHHFVFSNVFGWHSFPWLRIDDVSVVRSVAPAIHWAYPNAGAEFIEGTPIHIAGDAFGISSDLSRVQVFLGDRLLGTFHQSNFNVTLTDYDPGEQTLRIVARDVRGLETEVSRPLRILFSDGTLSPFVQYSFRTGLEGVTTSGSILNGYLDFNPSNGIVWISSPRLFLQAGETYTFQFDAHRGNHLNHTLFFSLEGQSGYPIEPEVLGTFNVNEEQWVRHSITFTVEASGPYFFTLFNDGNQTWNRLRVDNLRIVGNFNSAPSVNFTAPANNTVTLAGAPLTLSAQAIDTDGEVTRVDFWNGSLLIGSVFQPPYTWLWESAPVGDLTVTAIAHDNAGGVSNPAALSIRALENRVNISTNLGTSGLNEFIKGMVYQQDGTLVIGGLIDPSFFQMVTPLVLPTALPDQSGMVARLSEDGRTVLSVTVVGSIVADLSLDAEGNIYVAAGSTGILKLNPTADQILWHHTPAAMGIANKLAHRIDAAANGMTAALMSPTTSFGEQTLAAGDIALVHPDGTLHPVLMQGSGSTYTTDIAVDDELQRVWIAGWKNFVTFEGVTNFPVDVPIFIARSFAPETFNQRVIRGYDWESNDDNGRWLNRLDNNMADTRTQRILIAPSGDVYVGLEYDGGNTPIRYDPFDLSRRVTLVGGDNHHTNGNTSTVPKVAVVRLDRHTGAFKSGQFLVNRLSSGADNTIRLRGGAMFVDSAGRVHVAGSSASGTPLTFDPLPGVYNGGPVHWVLSPDLSTREMVTRWADGGELHSVAVSPSGKVAVGGRLTGDVMYRRRALLTERQSSSDALLVVGDFAHYYSFQPGNHPRLFFTAQDIPEMRYRATLEPFDAIVDTLRASREDGWAGGAFDENHSYDRSNRAKINAFLYVLTGDEDYAIAAREDVEWVIDGRGFSWADPTLMGLRSYWMATHVALAYDWAAQSPHWDDAFLFRVSKALVDMARMILNNGGTEQNTNPSSNWQGARGASGGLALLAADSRFEPVLLDAAFNRVRTYIHQSVGIHPETRGWVTEGLGYTYYPYGLFVGPFAMAMAHVQGRDLRDETAISEVYRALLTAPTAAVNVLDYGGIKPDWANDNMHIRGEGVYGQAFFFLDPSLLPAARHVYDRLQGPLARDRARWDGARGGSIWTFLHYPAHSHSQSPVEFYHWHRTHVDQQGIGVTTFRNQFEDETDILAQFKARLFTAGGHDGPDGLGFRIIANDTAWVVGGGRDDPGKRINQPTLYRVEPGAQLANLTNLNTGELVGTPLVKVDGGGHIIAQMNVNNMGVHAHKRWFITDFDASATGAQAAFLVADTSTDGSFWQMPTSPFNTISVHGNTFTITAPNGATLLGTVLHPSGAVLAHGSRQRGSDFAPLNGGSSADVDPILNPLVVANNFVTVQGQGGDFLIAFTIQPQGETHPEVNHLTGAVADAVVQIGSRTYTLTPDSVWYDGQPYSHAPAHIAFDVGNGSVLAGQLIQEVVFGGSPEVPSVMAPEGYVFLGWNRSFDAVTRDMTVSAVYAPFETVPTAPSFLRGIALPGGTVSLRWNDNSVGETGFTVQQSMDGGSSWSTVATLPDNTDSVDLAGRNHSTAYSFRVRAEGTVDYSAWSNVLVLVTPPLNQAPFFVSTPPTIAHEGSLFNYFIQAEDPDEDSMNLTLVEGPEWLTLYNSGGGAGVLTGVPVADAEVVSILIAVSDAINPPVLQSFELHINPAPVITLEWPVALPVHVRPDHGIYAEVSVVDSLPVALSWAVVQGPLGSVIDDEHAAATGIYFERAGTYILRLTATDSAGATSQLDFTVLVDREPVRQAIEVLAFNADTTNYTEGQNRSFRNSPPSDQELDINGDGVTDRRRFHAFSTQNHEGIWTSPLNPTQTESMHGGRFFGGMNAERFGSTTLNFTPNPGFDTSGRLSMRFSSAYPARMHAAFFWLREDFKNIYPGADLVLGANSRFDILFGDFLDVGQVRWMVLADGRFYVSQSIIQNTTAGRRLGSAELVNELWAEYQPTGPFNLNFDQANAQFTTTTSQLGRIEAVGFMIDADNFTANRRFQLQVRQFLLRAEISEPYRTSPQVAIELMDVGEQGSPAWLDAQVTFDAQAADTVVQWSVVQGPGAVVFENPEQAQTMVSASLPGVYVLRLSASDDQTSGFRDVIWLVEPSESQPESALELWLNAQFAHLPGGAQHADAALVADPDKDGIPNLLEFALSGNPLMPNTANLPILSTTQQGGDIHLMLTVNRNPEATALRYIVEVSGDLETWQSTEGVHIHTLLNSATAMVVEDAMPVTPQNPRFIRLRVELAE